MQLLRGNQTEFRYRVVAEDLKQQVIQGVYKPGQRFPRQHDLAAEQNVAFATLKKPWTYWNVMDTWSGGKDGAHMLRCRSRTPPQGSFRPIPVRRGDESPVGPRPAPIVSLGYTPGATKVRGRR